MEEKLYIQLFSSSLRIKNEGLDERKGLPRVYY